MVSLNEFLMDTRRARQFSPDAFSLLYFFSSIELIFDFSNCGLTDESTLESKFFWDLQFRWETKIIIYRFPFFQTKLLVNVKETFQIPFLNFSL